MIESIEKERILKLESMFFDKMSFEKKRLIESLEKQNRYTRELERIIDSHLKDNEGDALGVPDFDRFYRAHLLRVTRFMVENVDQEYTSKRFLELFHTCLIHNALEKKSHSYEQILERYGLWSADAIRALTQDREAMKSLDGREKYYSNLEKMDKEIFLIKICDKFDNLFAQCLHDDKQRRDTYYQEALTYLKPHMSSISPKLEKWFDLLMKDNEKIGFYRPVFN